MGEKITIKKDGEEIEISKDDLYALLKEERGEEEPPEPKEQGEPTLPPGKRNLHYKFDSESNPKWKGQDDVWLKETEAISFHNEFLSRGGKFLGDQNGNMTPPRDFRSAYYNMHGDLIRNKKRSHG